MAIPLISTSVENEAWTADEMKVVERCDALLRDRGMQMGIVCTDCYVHGRYPGVLGDNKRSANNFFLTCACKRRGYTVPVS